MIDLFKHIVCAIAWLHIKDLASLIVVVTNGDKTADKFLANELSHHKIGKLISIESQTHCFSPPFEQ